MFTTEHQLEDRQDFLFGEENDSMPFFFEVLEHFSSLCGLCVDGEDCRLPSVPHSSHLVQEKQLATPKNA